MFKLEMKRIAFLEKKCIVLACSCRDTAAAAPPNAEETI